MDWDIPRYWGADNELHTSDIDGPPSYADIEVGDSFLLHWTDDDDVEHFKWVHGGIDLGQYDDLDDAIADAIDALTRRGSL
jgi:hypothetical protein